MIMMKRIFLFLVVFTVLTPSFAFAEYEACIAGSFTCNCTYSSEGEKTSPTVTIQDGNDAMCINNCMLYSEYSDTNWYLTCDVAVPASISSTMKWSTPLKNGTIVQGTSTTLGAESTEVVRNPVIPILNVPIPGLDFGDSVTYDSEGNQQANFLAKYIDALYRYLIVIAAVVAIVMVMVGGLQYILSRGNAEAVKKAKERITNAVIGLVLLFAAYDIAFLLDPDTVRFESLSIKTVPFQEVPEEFEDDFSLDGVAGEVLDKDVITIPSDASSYHIINHAGKDGRISLETYNALKTAAAAYYKATGENIVLADASRTVKEQASLFSTNCLTTGVCNKPTCNVDGTDTTAVKQVNGKWTMQGQFAGYSGEPAIIAMTAYGKAANCKHTSNVAVDVWAEGATGPKGAFESFNVTKQNALITAMLDNGFLRLSSEPWHFELIGKASSACRNNRYTTSDYCRNDCTEVYSTNGCWKWRYNGNCCLVALGDPSKLATMCTGN